MAMCKSVLCANFPKAINQIHVVFIVNEFIIRMVNYNWFLNTAAPLRVYHLPIAMGLINNKIARMAAMRIARMALINNSMYLSFAPARCSETGRGHWMFMTVIAPSGSRSSLNGIGLNAAHGVRRAEA